MSIPVDVPIMAAAAATAPAAVPASEAKQNTPTAPQSETVAIVRHRRQSRRDPTAEPKASPLPHPPLWAGPSEHSKAAFAELRRMKDHGRSRDVLTSFTSHASRICYTQSAFLTKNLHRGRGGAAKSRHDDAGTRRKMKERRFQRGSFWPRGLGSGARGSRGLRFCRVEGGGFFSRGGAESAVGGRLDSLRVLRGSA